MRGSDAHDGHNYFPIDLQFSGRIVRPLTR